MKSSRIGVFQCFEKTARSIRISSKNRAALKSARPKSIPPGGRCNRGITGKSPFEYHAWTPPENLRQDRTAINACRNPTAAHIHDKTGNPSISRLQKRISGDIVPRSQNLINSRETCATHRISARKDRHFHSGFWFCREGDACFETWFFAPFSGERRIRSIKNDFDAQETCF